MPTPERNFAIVNGIAIGEESKGNTVQAVVHELGAHTVWRSGGSQGGHHISHDDGREMAFSHFGAGVFEGADTYLKHMVISPMDLFHEALELERIGTPNPFSKIVVDEDCIATTPYHRITSRTREILRGKDKKGTIGVGVGEAMRDSTDPELTIRAGEFHDRATVVRKAENIRRAKLRIVEDLLAATPNIPEEIYDEIESLRDETLSEAIADGFYALSGLIPITDETYLRRLLEREGSIVNEVSHGALHHPRYGFVPHITEIDPTSGDVRETLRKADYTGNLIRLGIVRSYLTRHGAGPLVSFDQEMTDELLGSERHNNKANDWLGEFRIGHFDTVALRYAIEIAGGAASFDGLFISFMDMLSKRKEWGVVQAYEYTGESKNLEDYFLMDGGKIVGIKVHPDNGDPEHINHQRRLTQLIKECQPVVTTIKAEQGKNLEEVFLRFVRDNLKLPTLGVGYGPRPKDRFFLPSWQSVRYR